MSFKLCLYITLRFSKSGNCYLKHHVKGYCANKYLLLLVPKVLGRFVCSLYIYLISIQKKRCSGKIIHSSSKTMVSVMIRFISDLQYTTDNIYMHKEMLYFPKKHTSIHLVILIRFKFKWALIQVDWFAFLPCLLMLHLRDCCHCWTRGTLQFV